MRTISSFVVVTVLGSFVGCNKSNLPTGPTPTTTCQQPAAINFGGPLPCVPRVVELPNAPLWAQLSPGGGVSVKVPATDFPGRVEAQIGINEPGTYQILFGLVRTETNTFVKYVVVPITNSGTISLPHEEGYEGRAVIRNVGTTLITVVPKFYYIRD